ncbi:hypothetical protein QR680_004205 [Steinernema hermaphroditum]|uniref:Uncharacterized protein n=1 Tax=Steinernema hermaphroditum TaxID=289476 RepID=A0AA39LTC1_9BILA|nr:hypothetical protein QR680_004205 [Steinernema hermaphroditum]
MKSTCVLLIPLFLLVAQVSCSIRFSYLGSHYDGTFVEEVGVSSTGECTLLAFNKKKIGYRVKVNEGKKTCALLTTFNRFTTLNDSNIRDYILTISISDQVCTVNTTKKATEFISGQCKPDEWDCELLKKMRDYCIFVGSDKPDCISSTGVSMEKVECPKGQHRVAVKKETLLPCCPEKKVLKEVLNDTAICCGPADNYQEGSGLCCPFGLILSKSSSGSIGCCPSGEEFGKREGGIDYCCPKRKKFQEVQGGKAICCPGDQVLKGYFQQRPICCRRIGNDGECCNEGSTLRRAPNDKVICCPEKSPKPLVSEDGHVACCREDMKKLISDDNTSYICSV